MIKAPNWARDARASTRGWLHPNTGELLVARQFSRSEVKEYNNRFKNDTVEEVVIPKAVVEKVEEPKMPETLKESPTNEQEFVLEHMTKDELKTYAEDKYNLEIDGRWNENRIIKLIKEAQA